MLTEPKCPSISNLVKYRRLHAKAQCSLISAKRKSWLKFLSIITYNTPSKFLWEKIQALKKPANWLHSYHHVPGNIFIRPPNIAESFALFYQQASSDAGLQPTFLSHKASLLSAPSSVHDNGSAAYNRDLTAVELQYGRQYSRNTAPKSNNFNISLLHNSANCFRATTPVVQLSLERKRFSILLEKSSHPAFIENLKESISTRQLSTGQFHSPP